MSKKILIVDDDPDILEVTSMILENKGYEVSTSTSGDNIRNIMPYLLLLDIWMAGRYGSDICKELKNDLSTKNIKIIMLSANRDVHEIATECGADSYISKPFKMKELVEEIKNLVGPA